MIRFLLLLILPFVLNASKILSYNIYDRTERVDVMITFDTPYEGVIKQSSSGSKIIIKLQDATIESSKVKQLSSKFLQSLSITPMSGYTQIVASVPSSTTLQASKTSDSYGLRLRFSDKVSTQKQTASQQQSTQNSLSALPTKNDTQMTQSYYIVVAILIIGVIILLFIKKKVTPQNQNQQQNGWLFKETKAATAPPEPQAKVNDVSIRFQKAINSESSVVMLDFGEQSYLVLMGKNNILLDKFTENIPTTQEDFESILQTRHKQLDDFLETPSEAKEPIDLYKEKAANISYNA